MLALQTRPAAACRTGRERQGVAPCRDEAPRPSDSELVAGSRTAARLFARQGADVVGRRAAAGRAPPRVAGPLVDDAGVGAGEPRPGSTSTPASAAWSPIRATTRQRSSCCGGPTSSCSTSDGRPAEAARALSQRIARGQPGRRRHVVLSGFGLDGPVRGVALQPARRLGVRRLPVPHRRARPRAAAGRRTVGHVPARAPRRRRAGGRGDARGAHRRGAARRRRRHGGARLGHQWTLTMYTHTGAVKRRWGNLLGESFHPMALYQCRDGVDLDRRRVDAAAVGGALHHDGDCRPARRRPLDARRALRAGRRDRRPDQPVARRHDTADEAVDDLQEHRVPASRLLTMSQVLPSRAARRCAGFLVAPARPRRRDAAMPWTPFRLEDATSRSRRRRRSAPTPPTCCAAARRRRARPVPPLDLARRAHPRVRHRVGRPARRPLARRPRRRRRQGRAPGEPRRAGAPDATFADGWTWGELPHPMVRAEVFPDAEPGERRWNRMGMWNKMNRSKRSLALDAKSGGRRRGAARG